MDRRRIGAILIALSVGSGALFFLIGRNLFGVVEDRHEGGVEIPSGAYFAFNFTVYGNSSEIGYTFMVQSGPRVDIYLLTPSDFDRYKAGLPPADWPTFAHENVASVFDESPYLSGGTYTAVIDNTNFGIAQETGASAVVRYSLQAGGIPGDTRAAELSRVVVVLSVLLILFVAFLAGIVLVPSKPGRPIFQLPRVPPTTGTMPSPCRFGR